MSDVIAKIGDGFSNAFLMAYEVWWALVLGFAISAIVQAWVPRRRIEATLAGQGIRPVSWATVLGAASSSCSYAAIAIAKSLFQKGASAVLRGSHVHSGPRDSPTGRRLLSALWRAAVGVWRPRVSGCEAIHREVTPTADSMFVFARRKTTSEIECTAVWPFSAHPAPCPTARGRCRHGSAFAIQRHEFR
jgi:predicted permease